MNMCMMINDIKSFFDKIKNNNNNLQHVISSQHVVKKIQSMTPWYEKKLKKLIWWCGVSFHVNLGFHISMS
jgi:hypothetical protein